MLSGRSIPLVRIFGIRIGVDPSWFLALFLFIWWLSDYYRNAMPGEDGSAFILATVSTLLFFLSILLHELGHAFAGRLFRARVAHIELTGLGGLAHFERSLPRSVFARSTIYLAGPAVNLGLWYALGALAVQSYRVGAPLLAEPLGILAGWNFVLLVFNLLPAYPLDGGHTLDAWLGRLLGPVWSVRIVAGLGLLCAAGIAALALQSVAIFMFLVAVFLAMWNWQKLQSVGGWQR